MFVFSLAFFTNSDRSLLSLTASPEETMSFPSGPKIARIAGTSPAFAAAIKASAAWRGVSNAFWAAGASAP